MSARKRSVGPGLAPLTRATVPVPQRRLCSTPHPSSFFLTSAAVRSSLKPGSGHSWIARRSWTSSLELAWTSVEIMATSLIEDPVEEPPPRVELAEDPELAPRLVGEDPVVAPHLGAVPEAALDPLGAQGSLDVVGDAPENEADG